MKEGILLTGGTGFLGTELAARLAKAEEAFVYVLVRAADGAEAAQRLRAAWQHDRELYQSVGRQLLPLPGDFTKADLGLSAEALQALRESVTLVIHAGAEIGFDKSKAELDQTNVDGTRNMIVLAQSLPRLRRFLHISTAYVAGRKHGRVMEEELPGERFSSLYEQSKAEAENLLRASGLPWSICRPGMIVGDSETGWVRNFNTVYYVLKQLLLGKIRLLPIREDTPLNLVPVDMVADAALTVARTDAAKGQTFHLTCPKDQAPTAGELCDAVIAWAQKHLSVRLKRPVFLPLPAFKKAGLAYNQKEDSRKKSSLHNLLMLLPYFYADQAF